MLFISEFINELGLAKTIFLLVDSLCIIVYIFIRNTTKKSQFMVYKFRSECMIDILRLVSVIPPNKLVNMKNNAVVSGLPDTETEIETDLTLEEIKNYMKQIPDGHVMIQTVSLKTTYTGKRDYSIQ